MRFLIGFLIGINATAIGRYLRVAALMAIVYRLIAEWDWVRYVLGPPLLAITLFLWWSSPPRESRYDDRYR